MMSVSPRPMPADVITDRRRLRSTLRKAILIRVNKNTLSTPSLIRARADQ